MGCCLMGNKQGEELLAELQRLLSFNNVVVENPIEISAKGSQLIETYFDMRRYRIWRSCQHSSVDSIKFGSMEDTDGNAATDKLPRLRSNSDMACQK
ncbi:NMDA receptor synaptonuclear signaling and neuronal migration factor-like [Liolophura sinensis]|uniref:NMDA receptor synaptonuclear signaling and neuronal migration factor-like n=1 Tax=Liolophura sinensis TaxID=3198878 RepID=UPI003159133C